MLRETFIAFVILHTVYSTAVIGLTQTFDCSDRNPCVPLKIKGRLRYAADNSTQFVQCGFGGGCDIKSCPSGEDFDTSEETCGVPSSDPGLLGGVPSQRSDTVDRECQAGQYGPSGRAPCSLCDYGYYSSLPGQSQCTRCNSVKPDTRQKGSTKQSDCMKVRGFKKNAVANEAAGPHFIITDADTSEHLCFDYSGDDGELVDLVIDRVTGIQVTGILFRVQRGSAEYFSTIRIKTNNTRIRFDQSAIRHRRRNTRWTFAGVVEIGDVTLRRQANTENILVDIESGITFLVNRRYDEQIGRHSLAIFVVEFYGFSDTTTGLIGTFLFASFEISEADEGYTATVSLKNGTVTVPVTYLSRLNPVDSASVSCWVYSPQDGQANELI